MRWEWEYSFEINYFPLVGKYCKCVLHLSPAHPPAETLVLPLMLLNTHTHTHTRTNAHTHAHTLSHTHAKWAEELSKELRVISHVCGVCSVQVTFPEEQANYSYTSPPSTQQIPWATHSRQPKQVKTQELSCQHGPPQSPPNQRQMMESGPSPHQHNCAHWGRVNFTPECLTFPTSSLTSHYNPFQTKSCIALDNTCWQCWGGQGELVWTKILQVWWDEMRMRWEWDERRRREPSRRWRVEFLTVWLNHMTLNFISLAMRIETERVSQTAFHLVRHVHSPERIQ